MEQGPNEPSAIIILPSSSMDKNGTYSLKYLPVYVSSEEGNLYSGGPILEKLPHEVEEPGFIQSLTQTCQIGSKKVSEVVIPVAETVAEKVGQTLKSTAEVVSAKYHKLVSDDKEPEAKK